MSSPRKRITQHFGLLIVIAIMAITVPVGALANYHSASEVTQQTAIFPVSDPPEGPFQAHQSFILFEPGAEAPLHRHGGPGYITILTGELTLYEDGVETTYVAGDNLVEVPESLYKGGNYTDEDTTLMVTYLVPHGEEVTTIVDDPDAAGPPEIPNQPLATAMYEFTSSPESFDLIHTVSSFDPDARLPKAEAAGDTLLTAVIGSLRVSIDGEDFDIESGHHLLIEAGQSYAVANSGDITAQTMGTELAPKEAYPVMPATGSTPFRAEPAVWLILMAALSLLVIGASLRLGWTRA